MSIVNYDVAIIGYGPIGKLVASLLGQKGWKVGVFEKYTTPYGLPRAVKYDHEVTRALQTVIPDDEIKQVSQKVHDYYEWCNADRKTLLKIDWSQDGISGWPADMFFNQADLEVIMDKACKKYPTVDIHLGYEAVYLTEQTDQVSLILKQREDKQETIQVNAKYVIGCDGANSFVRDNMEHTTTDLGFYSNFLITDIIPKEDMEFDPMNLQVCDPERPTTVVSGGPGRRRWEFMLLPGETMEEFNKEEVAWEMLKSWNITPENATLERYTVYTFKARWVEEWRKGRLMLAGDAAHLTPPFMGQGMSSGIRDAKNIAWKLDLVLNGLADEALLDTYTDERKPHMKKLIDAAIYLGKMICVTDLEEAKKRDEAFLSGNVPEFPEFPIITDGVIFKDDNGEGKNGAGEVSLQAVVNYQGKVGLFDNVVGKSWTVIGLDHNPKTGLSGEQIRFMQQIGAQFVQISANQENLPDSVAGDVEGKYSEYFSKNGFKSIVVRPDYYLFGGATTDEELSVMVDSLSNLLSKKEVVVKQ
ncbi:bifunctional 3-(3-hydroxy-phenyl)propionate/3-hydroxycinnamic acid hydroxylase MhpA [Oceanobacillus halotolerans]|uniref:bifunctional 3-(3-hydroxy-phenyl)propionate/3-hydroxycinnamic acid hydroxylase MhpA n=1 Tax=Oceanobacillus halotolerans TaxID=2663380 RepID=UPI0013DCEF6C|nr:bifunctional 3-(3-hydroxy-phenyl)propionate/3-hydroxycinnamic acid hydroxylase [Oceanobacillus halotolerans]